jgi:hypothetical protein
MNRSESLSMACLFFQLFVEIFRYSSMLIGEKFISVQTRELLSCYGMGIRKMSGKTTDLIYTSFNYLSKAPIIGYRRKEVDKFRN